MLRIDQIGHTLAALAGESVPPQLLPANVRFEADLDARGPVDPAVLTKLGPQTPISCPDCHGPTWLVQGETPPRVRCYLGHANTALELLNAGAEQVETALWSAIRALSDRAVTFDMLAADALGMEQNHAAEAYTARAKEARKHSEVARAFMQDLTRRLEPSV
ncbi:MAG: hypothetical protein H0T42_27385 [Deltaproteobacteria bacterium]|nr:hypothetical protein [Deltaproteobacteria bacterium]